MNQMSLPSVSSPSHSTVLNGLWHTWAPPILAVLLVAVLICLAAANVLVRANWNERVDGILWGDRPAGVTAIDVGEGEVGDLAGIASGDLLLAIDGVPVQAVGEVVEALHSVQDEAVLTYTLLRLGQSRLVEVTLQPAPISSLETYFVLVGIGVFTLLVGASVRLRHPGTQATLHFFWLSVAFFGMFAFSFSGRLDRLDWVFYWADAISTLLLAPMLVHFALVFPERASGGVETRLGGLLLPIVYAPAVVLGVAQAVLLAGDAGSSAFRRAVEVVWSLEVMYLATCVLGGLSLMILTLRRVASVTSQRQLRWIVWGALLGGLPFALGYAFPWAFGLDVAPLDVTAIPLGLIPLAFALAIVRYRLRDIEVIVKRWAVYGVAVSLMIAIYLILDWLAREVFLDESDEHNAIIALLATAVVVLVAGPIKNAIELMLDRAHYRDRYDYRRALVGFARELNSDLDLNRLAERLVTRVTETLAVNHTVLMLSPLAPDPGQQFRPSHAGGGRRVADWPVLRPDSSIGRRLVMRQTVMLDDSVSAHLHPGEEVAFWREQGIHYFVPCVSEEGTIAVLALGTKNNGSPLSSEDVALLSAVAAQVATAIENGRLYSQLQSKAAEVDRIREFNENIVQSLNDGLVVLDLDDRVLRWNSALERIYGVNSQVAVGKCLDELFDSSLTGRLEQVKQESSDGATLYRVPLRSRHEEGGRHLLVNVALAPLRTPGGETSGMIVILEDITERVQLEEQLQLSDKMASVGLLAAGVAHEVNTPLTGISSFTQMLLEGTDSEDPRTPLLEKIEQQTVRAAKIVNGLLNLSRQGRPDSSTLVDVNVMMSDVLVLLEHQLQMSNIKLRKELSETATVVKGVEFKLQQVFLNIILNACDAMPTGGWLSIASWTDGESAVIEVADSGSGIAREDLSRIYDPFFTTKEVGQGTGLGLSIAYGVIKEHGGTIGCQSGPGDGTRFKVTLPLQAQVRAVAQN
ncbi:MAG: hypothetical protein CL484_16170 [Acidobacteria bacterium]|nr:hypothetical protein [Acidobacteriota bacterium]